MRRIVSLALLMCLLCGLFAGCKAKKQANTATDVEVIYWETGYGRAWLDNIIKAFNDSQDVYHAVLVSSAENRIGEVSLGDATGDLYIGSWNAVNSSKQYLHPLDDFLATKLDGEDGLTVAEKMGTFVENNKHPDGHVYAIPSTLGSLCALMYNVDLMKDSDGKPYKLPNTTDELVDLCLDLYSDGTTPFIQYADYWYYVYEAWIAQYEGKQAFYDIWNGIYTDEDGVKHKNDVRCVTESAGRYEAYKVIYELLSPKGFTYTNTNSFNHTTAQTYFLNGYAAMMPNGSWIENEMGGGLSANILPMKTPVISALADKLGIRNDKHLSLIVDYVDGTTLPEADMAIVNAYDAEVIEAVREARNMYYGGHPDHVVIPNYSNCIEGALELLKYIYSDEGMRVASETVGSPCSLRYSADVDVDTSNWSAFMQESYKLMSTGEVMRSYLNEPVFYLTATDQLKIEDPIRSMTYRTDGGILTAKEFWAKETAQWEAKWPRMLVDAGLQ